jgi:hypothetical protein
VEISADSLPTGGDKDFSIQVDDSGGDPHGIKKTHQYFLSFFDVDQLGQFMLHALHQTIGNVF